MNERIGKDGSNCANLFLNYLPKGSKRRKFWRERKSRNPLFLQNYSVYLPVLLFFQDYQIEKLPYTDLLFLAAIISEHQLFMSE